MIGLFFDMLYPRTCGICGEINNNYLCKKCENRLLKYKKNLIYKSKLNLITYHAYLYEYKEIIRDLLINYKFNEKSYLYKTFSKTILKSDNICRFIKKYDIIIPVPIHKKRKKFRGYDQTELIAKEISKNLKVDMKTDILIKKQNIKPQSLLTKNERIKNIKGVYEIKNAESIINKKILLIDDIYTTGSTINECAKELKKAKVKEISAFTIAKN